MALTKAVTQHPMAASHAARDFYNAVHAINYFNNKVLCDIRARFFSFTLCRYLCSLLIFEP